MAGRRAFPILVRKPDQPTSFEPYAEELVVSQLDCATDRFTLSNDGGEGGLPSVAVAGWWNEKQSD